MGTFLMEFFWNKYDTEMLFKIFTDIVEFSSVH